MTRKLQEKVRRDGQVAVLYSPGYGAGWSTWNTRYGEELVYDPGLAEMVLAGAPAGEMEKYAANKWPDAYLGGLWDITVKWLPEGTRFRIEEYDGFERVEILDVGSWLLA